MWFLHVRNEAYCGKVMRVKRTFLHVLGHIVKVSRVILVNMFLKHLLTPLKKKAVALF